MKAPAHGISSDKTDNETYYDRILFSGHTLALLMSGFPLRASYL